MSSACRVLPGRAALPHHEEAQRAVGHLGGEVDVMRAPLERIEVLAEAVPLPVEALVEGRARDVLDALHQLDEPLVILVVDRREPDPAVAHDHRGHAMPGRRDDLAVPGRLPVVVAVHVDEARRDDRTVGVDHPRRVTLDPPDGGDPPVADRDVAARGCRARAVDDRAAADDQVVHRHHRPPRSEASPQILSARRAPNPLGPSTSWDWVTLATRRPWSSRTSVSMTTMVRPTCKGRDTASRGPSAPPERSWSSTRPWCPSHPRAGSGRHTSRRCCRPGS